MAPDRGHVQNEGSRPRSDSNESEQSFSQPQQNGNDMQEAPSQEPGQSSQAQLHHRPTAEGHHFTIRGIIVGLVIGIVICFSNMYFGLQTGWISSMAMPSALLGFAYFKLISRYMHNMLPFSPVENVLIQSVAGSVGTMPLGCGFVGVIPALNFLLTEDENGPLRLSLLKMIVFALGIAFFGVIFAVPLRKQVIIREKLKFPSGTAAALMIGVLHGDRGAEVVERCAEDNCDDDGKRRKEFARDDATAARHSRTSSDDRVGTPLQELSPSGAADEYGTEREDWKKRIRLLLYAFSFSSAYTLASHFIPLNDVPLFGTYLAREWLFTMNFSPAYVGQGIIMGAPTSLSMLFGALVGYGVLSPIARSKGLAPGPADDWSTGSKGWIVWISLAIMLVDSLISLGWLVLQPILRHGPAFSRKVFEAARKGELKAILVGNNRGQYSALGSDETGIVNAVKLDADDEDDADPSHLISTRTVAIGLAVSSVFCIFGVHFAFTNLIPISLTILALLFAMLLSVMGVRALGETDLNPVSGISKLTQLMFALFTPTGSKNAVIINLIAGALAESGALQAGDLMQDLKTGHLVGAAPNAQFYGQLIGSAVGAVVSALVYKKYTEVYKIPGRLFQVPTAEVWIYTARLVTGSGLPPKIPQWATGAAILTAITTILRMWLNGGPPSRAKYAKYVPGGIAVAVGMFNAPSFTFARAIGGVVSWYWKTRNGRSETPLIVLASGLVLGEGLFSIVNLFLTSFEHGRAGASAATA